MALIDGITRASGAALVSITSDLSIAALATRRYSLHRGALHPITAGATSYSDVRVSGSYRLWEENAGWKLVT
ncbi:hypothetical protein KCW65_29820, partial [Mycobacterium tuberculosis]|nr:hypothetical protein [Mycobacterium tuberculosis]